MGLLSDTWRKKDVFPSEFDSGLDLSKALLSGIGQNRLNPDQFDAYMSWYIEQMNRDEDFRRSTAGAQVERLMQAGMSRSAALQSLQATEYGNAETTPAGNVVESEAAKTNALTNIISQGLQLVEQVFALGTQMGLAQSTISVNAVQAQLYEAQKRQIETSNGFARLQYDGLTDVAMFMQAAHNYEERSGVRLPDSWDEALAVLQGVSYDSMPDVSTMAHDRYKKALENPYFYPTMLQQWRDKRRNDYDIANERKRASAEARYAELNIDKLNADTVNARKEYELMQSQQEELRARAQLEREQVATEVSEQNLNSSQAAMFHESYAMQYLKNQEVLQTDPETGKTFLREMIEGESKVEYYSAALTQLDYKVQSESVAPLQQYLLMKELQSWQNTPDSYWRDKRANLMKNEANQRIALDVLAMSLSNNEEFRTKFPNLSTLFDLFDSYGIFDAALRSFTTLGASSILGTSNVAGAAASGAWRLHEPPLPTYTGTSKW